MNVIKNVKLKKKIFKSIIQITLGVAFMVCSKFQILDYLPFLILSVCLRLDRCVDLSGPHVTHGPQFD